MRFAVLLALAAAIGAAPNNPETRTFKTLYDFTGKNGDGAGPWGSIALGSDGVIYGSTTGSAAGGGTVFSLVPPASPGGKWKEAQLWQMSPVDGSAGGVAVGAGGVLYVTAISDPGSVFSLTPPAKTGGAWTEATLWTFGGPGDGSSPIDGVAIGGGGVLYGTTYRGGVYNLGTVFSLTPPTTPGGSWTEAVLWSFGNGNDGTHPLAPVAVGSDGALYGTTGSGGAFSDGTVFSLTPPASQGGAWTENILLSFERNKETQASERTPRPELPSAAMARSMARPTALEASTVTARCSR